MLGQLAEFVSAVDSEVREHFAPEEVEIKGLRNPGRTAPARMRRIGLRTDPAPDPSGPPGDAGGAGGVAEGVTGGLDAGPAHSAHCAPQPAVAARGMRPQGGRRIVDRPGPATITGPAASAAGGGPSAGLGAGWLKQLALAGAAQARSGLAHGPVGPGLAPGPPPSNGSGPPPR